MRNNFRKKFIVGKKLYLRPIEYSDINDEYLSWMNNVELSKNIPSMILPNTKLTLEKYMEKSFLDNNTIFLAIIEIKNNKHIGNVKIFDINLIDKRAEFGRFIGNSKFRGKGYGSEVTFLILNYLFNYLNLRKVYATLSSSNVESVKSNEKYGMKTEAILKKHRYVNGSYEDKIFISVFKENFIKNLSFNK